MLFSEIKKILFNALIIGKLNKKKINNITEYSKDVNSNTLLVVDKNKNFKKKYLEEAISNGLHTIITNQYFKNLSITQIIVKELNFEVFKLLRLKKPFHPLKSIAITGTNGKTSTAWYLAQICKENGIPTKMTGTLGFYKNLKKLKETTLTTPNNYDLYQFGYTSNKNKFFFISEASSHGLHQGRYNNINIDVGAITNITLDHLDYHKNFRAYKNSKFSLFTKYLSEDGVAVVNSRIKDYRALYEEIKRRNLNIITFGSKDVYFKDKNPLQLYMIGKKYKIKNLDLNSIQKQNLECAIACALAIKISPRKIISTLHSIKQASGRYQEIYYKKKSSKIVIDYAHTPDAIRHLLTIYTINNLKPSILFGCGGERDKLKRKEMGMLVSKLADKIYLTDDNPRNENPIKIRKDIKKYCPTAMEIAGRKKAIKTAISQMNKNEILIIAGKGHENFQLIKNKKIKFDDFKIAKNYIK